MHACLYKQTEVPDYSILENEEPGFSEVESEIKQPEVQYSVYRSLYSWPLKIA